MNNNTLAKLKVYKVQEQKIKYNPIRCTAQIRIQFNKNIEKKLKETRKSSKFKSFRTDQKTTLLESMG